MAETLQIATGNKQKKYETLVSQAQALVNKEDDIISNLANLSSAIQMTFNFLWTGFYLLKDEQLILGPFQGPIACTRISKGKGVCGSVWEKETTIIVTNVNEFEGHISCSSESVSEIVVPIFDTSHRFIGVLDIDSTEESNFDRLDQKYLEEITQIITKLL